MSKLADTEFIDECLIGTLAATGERAAAGGTTLLSGTVTTTDLTAGGDRIAAAAVAVKE